MTRIFAFSTLLFLFTACGPGGGGGGGGGKKDTTPPETTITAGPEALVATTDATFVFESDDPEATFECRIDGEPYVACSGPQKLGGLGQGEHTFYVRATDAAGNVDASPAERSWTVDTVAPETTVDAGPADLSTERSPVFTFSSDEAGATFECRVDGGAFASCTSPWTATLGTVRGGRVVEVVATDPAGNVDATPAVHSWEQRSPDQLSMSGIVACWLQGDGALYCWGKNTNGEVGDGTTIARTAPVQEKTRAMDWARVANSLFHTCAVKTDGTLWCWGQNTYGQLGDDTTNDSPVPVQESTAATDWAEVAAGTQASCALKTDGTIWCWGQGRFLGDGSDLPSPVPVQEATGATTWTALAMKRNFACALREEGTVYCWGGNNDAQLGVPDPALALAPVQERTQASDWASIAVGIRHVCALKRNGALYCWGSNIAGQIGSGAFGGPGVEPTREASNGNDWVFLSAGGDSTHAIKADGTLWGWGQNMSANLGLGTITREEPLPMQEASKASDWAVIATDGAASCATKRDHTLWCWGDNSTGLVGVGVSIIRPVPSRVDTRSDWSRVLGSKRIAGERTDGTIWGWGANSGGSIGDGTTTYRGLPTAVSGGITDWISLSVSGQGCGVRAGGTLWCWGPAGRGGIGDGSGNDALVPTQESTQATDWAKVQTRDGSTCGIKTDGTLWCWGYNRRGKLGLGDSTDRSTPTQEATLATDWAEVGIGTAHSCGIKTDGTLWCWGVGRMGQLGNGGTSDSLVPVNEATAATDWSKVVAGQDITCALKTAGTLYCWGRASANYAGTGTGATSNVLVPTQEASGASTWTFVDLAGNAGAALRSDGSLWFWGGPPGGIGDGSFGPYATPTREATSASDWNSVAMGSIATCATKTDGTRWCWGINRNGEFGDGTGLYAQPQPVVP